MSNFHKDDHRSVFRQHEEFTETVGDAVMRGQDRAYALGRERGQQEADEKLQAQVAFLRQWIKEEGRNTNTCTWFVLRERCEVCQCHRSDDKRFKEVA